MALFYGQVDGMAETSAGRRGSRRSGIKVSAQSWTGSVIVGMKYDNEDNLMVQVNMKDISTSSTTLSDEVFYGKFEDLRKAFDLIKDIKLGAVSVTRHRAKSNKQKALEKAFKE